MIIKLFDLKIYSLDFDGPTDHEYYYKVFPDDFSKENEQKLFSDTIEKAIKEGLSRYKQTLVPDEYKDYLGEEQILGETLYGFCPFQEFLEKEGFIHIPYIDIISEGLHGSTDYST